MIRIFHRTRALKPPSTRRFSTRTLIGNSGREYIYHKILQRHPTKRGFDIYLASCEGKPFVLKPVSRSIFEFLKGFGDVFGGNSRLRLHVDDSESENENQRERENKYVLIYEYFKTDLFSLVENYPALSIQARKAILREVARALREMHGRGWVHLDVKPNNIFLNWYVDDQDVFHLQKVVLGDMDCALKLEGEKLLNAKVGNVMWRSPEGQLGRGVGKSSEVFCFGLLCLYVLTSAQAFHPDIEELENLNIDPGLVILSKLLSMFGPLPDALVRHVDDEEAGEMLKGLWQAIVEEGLNDHERFENWDEERFLGLDGEAKRFILRMTDLDPEKRAVMEDIVRDSFWD